MNNTSIKHQNFFLKSRFLMVASLMIMPPPSSAQPTSETVSPPQLTGGPLKLATVAAITLVNSDNIQQQALQVERSKSFLQGQRSAFDITTTTTVNKRQDRPMNYSNDADNQTVTVGVSKLFRTGISSSFSINLLRYDYVNYPDSLPSNTGTVRFSIKVPLLKGRGYTSADAEEQASQFNSEAAVQRYYNDISQTLLWAIQAYWNYRAAVENLLVYQASQQRVLGWVAEANKTLKVMPGTSSATASPQLSRLQAFLWDKERKVIEATDQVNQTKYGLATAMGITSDQATRIGEPVDGKITDFPLTVQIDHERTVQTLVTVALEKRFDLQEAKLNQQASSVRLAKARQDLWPQLDLELNNSRTGLKYGDSFGSYTGTLNPPSENRGTELGVTLNFSYALGNNAANSALGVANTYHQENVLQLNAITKRIRLEIVQSVHTLTSNLQWVAKAGQTIQGYQPIIDNYQHDLSQGGLRSDAALLFQVIEVEKEFVDATINRNKAMLELANIIATLRHQTGVLIDVNQTTNEASLKDITKLPEL